MATEQPFDETLPQTSTSVHESLMPVEDPNHPTRWRHRRRLAYTAMIATLATTVYVLGPWMALDRIEATADIISWFYFTMASIVGAYMGFATWSAKTSR